MIKQTKHLNFSLSPQEWEAFKILADYAGLGLSTWIREQIRIVAIKKLGELNLRVPFLEDK